MKVILGMVITLAVLLSGCASHSGNSNSLTTSPSPETVLITYHVIPGKEGELQQVLGNAWGVYRKEQLVLAEPHVIVSGKDAGDKTRYVEIFTWVSSDAPDHAPESVKSLWNQMQSCCEERDGHTGVDGGEVGLVVPSATVK
jgi:hypothetical protein